MNIVIILLITALVTAISIRFGGGKSCQLFDKNYTTIAKGIAILLIMVCHCSGHWTGGRILTPLGGVGVSIFLITSGYGLNESFKRSGLTAFWRKRLVRVYLPYFIVAIIFAIACKWDIAKCLLNFSCINCPYWFVTYILACYIIFWTLSFIIPKRKSTIMLLLSMLALFLLPNLQAEQSFGFVTGVILSNHKVDLQQLADKKKTYATLVVILMVIGISFLAIKQIPFVRHNSALWEMNIIQCFIKYPLSLAILLGLIWFPKLLRSPFLHLSGIISYELYLVHFPFYGRVGTLLWPAIVLIIISYLISYCFNKANNRIHNLILKIA